MPRPKPTPPRGPNPWEKQDRARAIRRAVIVISAVAAAVAGVVITMVVAIGPATPPPAPERNERTSSARAPAERAGASVTGNTASAEVPTQAVPMPGRRPPQAPLSEPPVAPGSHASMIEVIGPSQSPKPVVYASNEIVFGRYDAMKRGDGGADFVRRLNDSIRPAVARYEAEPAGGPTEALLDAVSLLGQWSPRCVYQQLSLPDPRAVLPEAALRVELRNVPSSVSSVLSRVRHVCDDPDRSGLERVVLEPDEGGWVEVRLKDDGFGVKRLGNPERQASGEAVASTWRIDVAPRWDNDALSRLQAHTDAEVQIEIRFPDGSVRICRTGVTIAPTSTCDLSFPLCAGITTLIEPGHPFLQELRKRIDASPLVKDRRAFFDGHPEEWKDAFLWFRELASMSVQYDNDTFAAVRGQRVRAVHEVLGGDHPQGNCIDLSLLMASALAGTGSEVYLVLVRGHAFIAFWDESAAWRREGKVRFGRLRGLECTKVDPLGEVPQPRDAEALMSGAELDFYKNHLTLPRDRQLFRQFVVALYAGTSQLEKLNHGLEPVMKSFLETVGALEERKEQRLEELRNSITSSGFPEGEWRERWDEGASKIEADRRQEQQQLIERTRDLLMESVHEILHVESLHQLFRPPTHDAADLRRMGFVLPPPSSPSPK